MLYFLLTTGKCNLKCKYCGGSFPEQLVPYSIKYSLKDLEDFISQDEDATIAFYGGEPLLNARFVKEVMERISAKRFLIQTNGLLVEKLELDYWLRMDTVLLSIDGRPNTTDYYRGRGVYRKVIEAAKALREMGFEGELVARMVLSSRSETYEDVTHLLSLGLFTHVHWQLDVIWSPRWNFEEWRDRDYKPALKKLVDFWTGKLEQGEVLGIVPFLGLVSRMLFGSSRKPPCGAGSDAFAILPNGKLLACPIAADAKWAYLGDLRSSSPQELRDKVIIGEPCINCGFYEICGGRCLYAYKEMLWGREGFEEVCDATKYLVKLLEEKLPAIKRLLEAGKLRRADLVYPRYNNSTEIVP